MSLKSYLLWKIIGFYGGALAGTFIGGNVIVWLSDPPDAWKVMLPFPEWIVAGIGGAIFGGALAGGRLGVVGVALLLCSAGGFIVGGFDGPLPFSPWPLFGAIIGAFLGFNIGVTLELLRNFRSQPPQRGS